MKQLKAKLVSSYLWKLIFIFVSVLYFKFSAVLFALFELQFENCKLQQKFSSNFKLKV